MSRSAAAAAGGGSGASVASTGSVAVSVVEEILHQNGVQIGSDSPLNSKQQAEVVAASVQAIDAAIDEVEPSRQWQEIVALIKVYGGWAGAALAVAINAYLAVSTNTIQGLIAALPGMLFRILSDPAIPGNVGYVAGTAVKASAAIVFMRALISYLSANSNTIFDDVKTANTAFLSAMEHMNPPIDKGGIAPEVLAELRINQLNFTTWNVTGKTKIIVDTALNPSTWAKAKETIRRISEVPFIYLSEAGTVLATYAIGLVGNFKEYIANRGGLLSLDSSASGSTASSHSSLWDRLLQDVADAHLLVEPAAGGGPAEKEVTLLQGEGEPIQANVLQVVLPQEEAEDAKREINFEIGNVLAGGGAGGGAASAVPSSVLFDSQRSDVSKITFDGDGDDPSAAAKADKLKERLGEQKNKRQEQFSRGRSEPLNRSVPMGQFGVDDYLERSEYGPEHPLAPKLPPNSQPGGKKRNSKRKTKKAKRTKKRSKKSSKRKTRR